MDPEDPAQDPDRPRPRPKVVDKRVSARPEGAAPAPPSEAPSDTAPTPSDEPDQARDEPRVEPDQPRHGDTPAGVSTPAASQDVWTPEQEERARQIAQEIAETPSFEWVVNTAVTLANVAGTKLDLGAVADAQLAIDAFGGIVETVGSRLQGAEAPLRQTLAQLRLAYAERATTAPPTPPPG